VGCGEFAVHHWYHGLSALVGLNTHKLPLLRVVCNRFSP
jgi:hypothetical protein